MLKNSLSIFVIVFLLFYANPKESGAVPVDLSGWTATDTVTISEDGYSAIFIEDQLFGPVSLSTTLDIPADAVSFSFDYELVVAAGYNEDYFDFYLDDLSSYLFTDGGYSSGTEIIFSGTYTVELSTYIGENVDIKFAMNWGWNDWGLDSILTISNVDIAGGSTSPVPEPGTVILLSTGLAGLAGLRKRNRARSL